MAREVDRDGADAVVGEEPGLVGPHGPVHPGAVQQDEQRVVAAFDRHGAGGRMDRAAGDLEEHEGA